MQLQLRSTGHNLASLTLALFCVCTLASGSSEAATWSNNASGDYNSGSNWSGGVPNAAGAVADFSTMDYSGDISVTLNGLSPTVGTMLFGDTDNAGSPTSWEIRSDDAILPVITFDNSGSTPSITVNPLGPTGAGFDDAFVGVETATAGDLNKEGAGKVTLNAPYDVPGVFNVNGGHLNLEAAATATSGPNFSMADGTELTIRTNFVDSVAVAGGATVTVNQFTGGTGASYNQDIYPTGPGASLNFNVNGTGRVDFERDWAQGNSFDNVTLASTEETQATDIRLVVNHSSNFFDPEAFADTNLTLNNVRLFTRTNSYGNNLLFGALSGDATAALAGGGSGSAARYHIGALNTNTEFAGILDGAGGLSINKVGTGTLTLSGGVSGNTPVLAGNADPGRQGGVVRVTEGTIATAGTFDHFASGDGTVNATIDVKAGATLDVSGSTNFHSVGLQQFIGEGTIVGPFDHQDGSINPGDVGVDDNDTDLTNVLVPTVGTINFSGTLSFNGGSIVYDMNDTPGTDDLVSVTGTTDLGTGGVIVPNFLGAGPGVGETYTVLSSTGGFAGTTSGWNVAWPGRGTKPSVVTNGNLLQFTTTSIGSVGDVVWSGSVDGDWDIEGKQNWTLSGSPDTYFDGDNVTFDDTGSNPTVNVTTSVAPTSMVVDSNTNNYSFSGSLISSTGTLTKRGSSTLTLGMTNEFNGGVTVEGGSIEVGAGGALGTGPMELQANTTVTTATGLTNSSITINGAGVTINNNVTSGVPSIDGTGELTISSNDAGETRLSTGTTENFSGTVNFTPTGGGTLWVRAGGATSDYPNAVVNMTGTTYSNRNGGSGQPVFSFGGLNGDAASILSGFGGGSAAPDAEFEIGGLDGDSTFEGVIQDGGGGGGSVSITGVRKIGTGTLTLTGANTYTGDTSIEAGTLSITSQYLSDAADIYLSTGAILDLDFGNVTFTDVVDSLFIDGIGQATGTWGRVGSGADHESVLFSGDGLISVTTVGTLPGDYDNDGDVDGTDFLIWQRGGSPNGATPEDLAAWQANYPTPSTVNLSSNLGAVPEPATWVLIAACGLGLLGTRKR